MTTTGNDNLVQECCTVSERNTKLELIQRILDCCYNNDRSNPTSTPSCTVEEQYLSSRQLYPTEIQVLQQNHCHSFNDSNKDHEEENWSSIRLLFVTTTSSNEIKLNPIHTVSGSCENLLLKLVSHVTFYGNVVLLIRDDENANNANNGLATTTTQRSFRRQHRFGIHNCQYVSNCIINIQHVSILDCFYIQYCCCIDPYCSIHRCGTITTSSTMNQPSTTTTTNNKIHKWWESSTTSTVSVGAESGGGYYLQIQPESNMIDIGKQIIEYNTNKLASNSSSSSISPMVVYNVFSSYCLVTDTPYIATVYMYEHSSIVRCMEINHVLLFPKSTIQNNCTVTNTILQWDCCIKNSCTIENTLCMEQSHCGPQSIVQSTILGPDVHVSCGEIHHSVIGPNTNSHHQSLLISILWLNGRGNVGYGSNIGSNHTGRIPDQIVTSGEGIFFGLSCSIIMPVDLSLSYYSLIAATTKVTPGRCTMPFSLLLNSNSNTNNGTVVVEVVPGWVLKSSAYTMERNEMKYSTRRKAKRHWFYTGYKVYRFQTMHQCYIARKELLRTIQQRKNKKAAVTNKPTTTTTTTYYISDPSCETGIQTYTHCIQRFALMGLYNQGLLLFKRNDINNCIDPIVQLLSSLFPVSSPRIEQGINDVEDDTKLRNMYDAMCYHHGTRNNEEKNGPCWPVLPWENEAKNSTIQPYVQKYNHHQLFMGVSTMVTTSRISIAMDQSYPETNNNQRYERILVIRYVDKNRDPIHTRTNTIVYSSRK